jgi:2,4-dienoyl-CoA reductase-like NADH-dependent reductase (Old Yellow Enzyme family)
MRIAEPLTLPCGATLSNRLAKSSMSEGLADRNGQPGRALNTLYATWARGGAGLLLSGNVMIDPDALGEPGQVIARDRKVLPALAAWAAQVHQVPGPQLWMQINHPGHQAILPLAKRPVSASNKGLPLPLISLRRARPLSTAEVRDLARQFADTAALAVEAGWDGVQIHAAHGYLLSQFLSPKMNDRGDEYGGNPKARRKILLDTVAAVRDRIGAAVPISVKLNSADFAHGGLDEAESLDVAVALADAGIDLLEISGGGAEDLANMLGPKAADRSLGAHEAFFLPYAEKLKQRTTIPVMLTGGLRSRDAMEHVLAEGAVDVIGLARPMAVYPDYPARLLAGGPPPRISATRHLPIRAADGMAQLMMHSNQFHRIAKGLRPLPRPGFISAARAAARTGINVARTELSNLRQ